MITRSMMLLRPVMLALLIACACGAKDGASPAPPQTPPRGAPLKAGQTLLNLPCQKAPAFHYDLYVSKSYKPDAPTPVLFVFSPGGRVPLDLYQAGADKLGWIVCGSVESRNGLEWPQYEQIFSALYDEMKWRCTVHPHRIYFSGMSGGTLVAYNMLCRYTDVAAGVIGMANGGNGDFDGLKKTHGAACVGIAGSNDYLYSGLMNVNLYAPQVGVAFKFVEWSGGHQWAPSRLVTEAMEWLESEYYIRSPYLDAAEKLKRPAAVTAVLKKAASLGATMEAYETYEALARDLVNDEEFSKQAAEALAKLKPRLTAEIEARQTVNDAFHEYYCRPRNKGDFSGVNYATGLLEVAKEVAKKVPNTVYGKRAATCAATLTLSLQMRRP